MSSGPLVAMITVAAIWIIYALSPASEATAAVEFGSHWFPWLYSPPPSGIPVGGQLTWPGFGVAAVLVGLLVATSLLTLRLITSFTVVASVVKVVVPVIVLVLLIRSGFDGSTGKGMEYTSQKSSFSNILTAVTSGGVIYTYTGFRRRSTSAATPGQALAAPD
jgi:amino acid transporter